MPAQLNSALRRGGTAHFPMLRRKTEVRRVYPPTDLALFLNEMGSRAAARLPPMNDGDNQAVL